MAEKENTFLNADNIYEDVEGEAGKILELELEQQSNLVGVIKDRFQQAEDARQTDEHRWLRSYENYRGMYAKSVKFRESEKSRVFVKVTKTKVFARDLCNLLSSVCIWILSCKSRAPKGSSSKSTVGSLTRALAIATLCFCLNSATLGCSFETMSL